MGQRPGGYAGIQEQVVCEVCPKIPDHGCRSVAAISDASRGLIDADLGGGVVKQRIARQGGGKSGGFRTIILFRLRERAFFVHGFAKNEQDNIRDDELAAFKLLAAEMMAYDDAVLGKAMENGTLTEVMCNG
jgi:hypothetical protein